VERCVLEMRGGRLARQAAPMEFAPWLGFHGAILIRPAMVPREATGYDCALRMHRRGA
jgi:hypothetical protein